MIEDCHLIKSVYRQRKFAGTGRVVRVFSVSGLLTNFTWQTKYSSD